MAASAGLLSGQQLRVCGAAKPPRALECLRWALVRDRVHFSFLRLRDYRHREGRSAELSFRIPFLLLIPHLLRSEEHTSELQSRLHLVCRLLLEKKKINTLYYSH